LRVCSIALSLYYYYYVYRHTRVLSFPTRRSSDLNVDNFVDSIKIYDKNKFIDATDSETKEGINIYKNNLIDKHYIGITNYKGFRSEEHTSELQSRFDLVCRLLLEKKKIVHESTQL